MLWGERRGNGIIVAATEPTGCVTPSKRIWMVRLTLTVLAEVDCLSPYRFTRSFKQAVGIGPPRYVMRLRLERAKTLMRRTKQPLATIAQETGFADQSHMTSTFRRETRLTPGRYRAAFI
jgi:AraC family transcriptional regulator